MSLSESFDRLVAEADNTSLTGWDFSHLAHRWIETDPPWDYCEWVQQHLEKVSSLLDLGTGGGEVLSSLHPLPNRVIATEGYRPNITVARARLEPLGIEVVEVGDDDRLPLPDEDFDLTIDRHESYDPSEIFRVLKSGGTFLTQQVGGKDNIEINQHLQEKVTLPYAHWNLEYAVEQLERNGFHIVRQCEAYPVAVFRDIGAVIHFLKATPWQISDFSLAEYRRPLRLLHDYIERHGGATVHSHRFIIEARKA